MKMISARNASRRRTRHFKSAIRIPQSEIFIECIRDWSPEVCYVLLSDRRGPVAQRLEQGLIIEERLFAHVFAALRTVSDARCFARWAFASRYMELRSFAANFSLTVENDRE